MSYSTLEPSASAAAITDRPSSGTGAAIRVENLGKRYILGQTADQRHNALRDVISSRLGQLTRALGRRRRNPLRESTREAKEFWALRDVGVEITAGTRMGIIGRNGAGKSTLLKILSRITEPTEGRVLIKGRVASLLEVGTGFHSELTGRENIFLNGAILGMTHREIVRRFDEIVDFSGVEGFLDTPVKRYSSGMYVRLAFAVAAHLEPEILVVDEVLAVGDAAFQKKCLRKMEDVGREGRTVLFVSHNMGAIQQLCSDCILLDGGRLIARGTPTRVISDYLLMGAKRSGEQVWEDATSAPGGDDARLHAVRVLDDSHQVCTEFSVRDPVTLEIEYWVFRDLPYLDVSFYLTNDRGDLLVVTFDDSLDSPSGGRPRPRGFYRSACHIPPDLLNDGLVHVRANLTSEATVYTKQPSVVAFHVVDDGEKGGARGNYHDGTWPAAALRPKLAWTIEKRALPTAATSTSAT